MFGAKNLLPCLATNYFQLLPHHSQFYHHTISNSTTTPFPILPPYHSQFYHHAIPNSTTIPFPILPPYHSQFYHHTIPNFTIISKSTIHCLILLLSTTISHSTIYHLFATKTTILPYHSQLYHHIQVYHLLPFCYKKNYHTILSFPTPPITTNSTIY